MNYEALEDELAAILKRYYGEADRRAIKALEELIAECEGEAHAEAYEELSK